MTLKRLCHLILPFVMLLSASSALAQSVYPSRAVTLVIPYPAGSSDTIGRMLATRLSAIWGQPVVVDNKPGASGITGMMAAKNATPDGYTLVLGLNGPLTANPHLFPKLPYDPLSDFVLVAKVVQIPLMIAASQDFPFSTLAELVVAAKKTPGKLEFASPGNGTGSHLAAEMFLSRVGANILHIPYKGTGPAMTDLLAGHVKLMFTASGDFAPHVRAGRIKAIAVTGKARAPQFPNVPAIAESYAGFEAVGWAGFLAPANTPPAIVTKISADLRRVLADPGVINSIVDVGLIADYQDGPDFRKYVQSEMDAVGKVIKDAKIQIN